jgi:hypothetical protein
MGSRKDSKKRVAAIKHKVAGNQHNVAGNKDKVAKESSALESSDGSLTAQGLPVKKGASDKVSAKKSSTQKHSAKTTSSGKSLAKKPASKKDAIKKDAVKKPAAKPAAAAEEAYYTARHLLEALRNLDDQFLDMPLVLIHGKSLQKPNLVQGLIPAPTPVRRSAVDSKKTSLLTLGLLTGGEAG